MKIEIEIDGKTLEVDQGSMIIEAADNAGIYIPRFCYHKKLSIAANCRMCLVEVEKAPKPLPACATPVTSGMKVFTQSEKAKDSQRAVMEFLLINHPLDCPICDQGGQCELQDLSMGYGKDISRYTEGKRSVADEDIGPLVETEMTRCIQCTRCVRFGQEIAGLPELGATGRGEHMRIGTFVKHSLESEMSGNIIDLCPVGALTSKPSRYKARPWELVENNAIAPHDCIGSNIHVHHRRQEVIRIAPRENEAINETWISDRDRFSYLGLQSCDRLHQPMIKVNGEWQETNWTIAFETAANGLKNILAQHGPKQIAALASPSATTEELYLLQKLMRGMGSHNIDHRLHQVDNADQQHAAFYPSLGVSLSELESQEIILLIGSNIQREQPIASHRVRKATLRGTRVLSVNVVDYPFNFPQTKTAIVSPNRMHLVLAAIAKSLLEKKSADVSEQVKNLLNAIKPAAEAQVFAEQLLSSNKITILLGAVAHNHPQASVIRSLAQLIAQLTGAKCGYLTEGANSAGAWIAGAIPHRNASGIETEVGMSAHQALAANLRAYVLYNVEPQLDCADSAVAMQAVKQADFVVAFSPFASEVYLKHADVILPIAAFTENEGSYVNAEGRWQTFSAVVPPPGEVRPGWKVLRVLANQLKLSDFDYVSIEQINTEIKSLTEKADIKASWYCPPALTAAQYPLTRITEWPIYSVDSLVRRSAALQASATNHPTGVYMHANLARQLNVEEGRVVTAKQGQAQAQLSVIVDSRVPQDCVWIPAGRHETSGLGSSFGEISIEI